MSSQILSEWSQAISSVAEAVGPTVVSSDGGPGRPNTSGVAWKEDGLFFVPAHSLERGERLAATLSDGQTLPAQLLGKDPTTDIALLKVAAKLKVPTFVPSASLKLGEAVVNVARPGRSLRVRVGVLKMTGWAEHSVLVVMSLESMVNPAAATPAPMAPFWVAMKTITSQVAGLVQSPSSVKPSAVDWVGGTLLPGARLPIVVPSVSS